MKGMRVKSRPPKYFIDANDSKHNSHLPLPAFPLVRNSDHNAEFVVSSSSSMLTSQQHSKRQCCRSSRKWRPINYTHHYSSIHTYFCLACKMFWTYGRVGALCDSWVGVGGSAASGGESAELSLIKRFQWVGHGDCSQNGNGECEELHGVFCRLTVNLFWSEEVRWFDKSLEGDGIGVRYMAILLYTWHHILHRFLNSSSPLSVSNSVWATFMHDEDRRASHV